MTVEPYSNCPEIFHLSDGHYMVNRISDEMLSLMWNRMSAQQRREFEIVHGAKKAERGFRLEVRTSDHAVAFFCGQELTCMMWAHWGNVGGKGRVRILGCVCSDFAVRHTVNFVKHSKEVRTAFEITEPKEVSELYVFIDGTFEQSRNWAVRVCGFKPDGMATANGESFAVYKHVIGEE